MKKIASLIALVVAISITGLTGCGLISKTPEAIAKTVVAKVGSEKMTKAEFDKRMQSIIGYYEQYYGKDFFKKPENAEALKQVKEQTLNNIADEMFALQKAKELKLDTDTAAINAEVDKQYKQEVDNAGGEDKLKTNMEAVNMTLDELKDNMKRQIIIGKLYDYVTKDVTVTDEEMKKYYQENLYDYTEKPNVMNLSHILVKTEDEALKIKEEYNSGKKFEDLVPFFIV
jgi:foldase protein PrsA